MLEAEPILRRPTTKFSALYIDLHHLDPTKLMKWLIWASKHETKESDFAALGLATDEGFVTAFVGWGNGPRPDPQLME